MCVCVFVVRRRMLGGATFTAPWPYLQLEGRLPRPPGRVRFKSRQAKKSATGWQKLTTGRGFLPYDPGVQIPDATTEQLTRAALALDALCVCVCVSADA